MGAAQNFQRLSAGKIRELRVYIDLLAVMLILHELAQLFEQIENISDATRAVVGFPIVVVSALLLLRVRQVRQSEPQQEQTDQEATRRGAGFSQLVEFLRRALFMLGIATPILGAFGYI